MPPNVYDELILPIETQMAQTVLRLLRDPDDAADTVQSVLESVLRSVERIRRHPNPHAYILRMCVCRAYDALRKRKRRNAREVSLDEVLSGNGTEPHAAAAGAVLADGREGLGDEEKALAEGILAAIAHLPPQQAQAVMLRVVNESSYAEIAEALGCAEATAYSHYSKGKARLREIFAKNGAGRETAS